MRVLAVGNMYPPHHYGGYELLWHSSMQHLHAQGAEVTVLTTDFRHPRPDPSLPEDPRTLRDLRWYWHEHDWRRLTIRERLALERHNGEVMARALAQARPDVVNWWAMGGMSLSLIEHVRRAGLPSVGVVGDVWMLYAPKVDSWMQLNRRLGPLARVGERVTGLPARFDLAAVRWLFMSDTTRRQSVAGGLELPHAEVAHPGVNPEYFVTAPEHDWRWRLLYVGRIDERKGVDTAVETLALLPPTARLTVLGSGDDSHLDELRARAGTLGLEGRVEFALRPRDELPAAYADADVVLFPVRWEEPWGVVPLESMAVGTPVVATGTGGSGEFLRDGENALVLGRDAGAERFAAAVRRLAEDAGLRARVRAGGLGTAERFTERAYNERIAEALASAAERR